MFHAPELLLNPPYPSLDSRAVGAGTDELEGNALAVEVGNCVTVSHASLVVASYLCDWEAMQETESWMGLVNI